LGKYGYTSNMDISEKLLIAIVRVSEAYKKDSSAIFKDYGLTFAQYTVLRVLEGSENRQNTIGNVSKIMLVSGANTTPIAKRLEKNGFLEKRKDPKDDRLTILEITPKGSQTLANIQTKKNELLRGYLSGYNDERKNEILTAIRDILKTFRNYQT
jgi:MarR family transcriptional regulator, 2-MHQ and catechol-resistance regulon repressor